jgi:hypothetical protein
VKKYTLIRYKYGVGGRYTAFCLTPSLNAPKTVERFGKTFEITSKGTKSSNARHFQTPEAAQTWLDTNQAETIAPCWLPLSGTIIWRGR